MTIKQIIRTAETHPLTWRLRDDKQPVWFDEYRSKNGYVGADKALKGMSQDEIVAAVKDSGLKGRGGAGFSTGLKWSLMPKDESMNIRYLLCNADEMEPGTYKDRLLMEQLPHQLVEGMLISAFALKAYRGYIFLRGEYIEAACHCRSYCRGLSRQKHSWYRLRFRAVCSHRCGPLYLWRRDRADQLAGRAPR